MTVNIGGYDFEGPYEMPGPLRCKAGVYAILDHTVATCRVLDVGESSDVKTRVENHERKGHWRKLARGILKVAVRYTPNLEHRSFIEQEVRDQYDPPCGER